MDAKTSPYMIDISENARSILDSQANELLRDRMIDESGIVNPYATGRASLKPLFHNSYYDMRPDWLVKIRAWSIEERNIKTMVMLTKEQIAQVLQLSIDMDIDPKPNATNTMNPSSRGTLRYLLSTFLEAVLVKHLVKKEDRVS